MLLPTRQNIAIQASDTDYNRPMPDREPSILGVPPGARDGAAAVSSAPVVLPGTRPGTSRQPVARDDAPVVWAAGFWRRTAAAIFDGLVVSPLLIAVVLSASKLAGLNLPILRRGSIDTWLDLALAGDPAFLGALGLAVAVLAVYLFLFQSLAARTIGMRALGLTIIDLVGAPITPWRAGLRTLGYLACLATLGLGFVWVGFDREKRGLHDWLAGTLVTRRTPRGARRG
jgi:uncharacterized RDD family membrane protein YckC